MRQELDNTTRALRNAAARQIKLYRRLGDRNPAHTSLHDRHGAYYTYGFYGLEHTFNYIRSAGIPQVVVDVGAGTTRGIADIARSYLGEGLSFEATVLNMRPEIDLNLGRERVRITSAEAMRGFEDGSVGCILGMLSFDYTFAPRLVAERFKEILAPGGVVKAALLGNKESELPKAFMELGFDVAVITMGDGNSPDKVMVAIKPGGTNPATAIDLLRLDHEDFSRQVMRV